MIRLLLKQNIDIVIFVCIEIQSHNVYALTQDKVHTFVSSKEQNTVSLYDTQLLHRYALVKYLLVGCSICTDIIS